MLDTLHMQAERWVKNMSKPSQDVSTKVELKARPPRYLSSPACPLLYCIIMSTWFKLISEKSVDLE